MSSEGRFTVSEQAVVSPGQCFICQSVTGAPFIDTSVDIMGYGVFYVCSRCLGEMYSLLTNAVKDRDAELKDAFDAGVKAGEERAWTIARETLNAAMGTSLPSSGHDIPVRLDTPAPVEGAPEVESGNSSGTEGKPERNKSNGSNAVKQGPDDVSGLESDGNLVFKI